MDRPPKRYLGPITIIIVAVVVVGGAAILAMMLSERPEEIAGRTPPAERVEQSESSTAQDSRRSPAQQRAVPGLPKE